MEFRNREILMEFRSYGIQKSEQLGDCRCSRVAVVVSVGAVGTISSVWCETRRDVMEEGVKLGEGVWRCLVIRRTQGDTKVATVK